MSDALSPAAKPPRLSADKKKAIRLQIASMTAAGKPVTTSAVRAAATAIIGREIDQVFAERLLQDFGFHETSEVDPFLGSDGSLQWSRIWAVAEGAKALTPAEGARALEARIRILMEAFVSDLIDDPLLQFSSLEDRALESSRLFALVMSNQVQARARFGAKKILPACADVAAMGFKSSALSAS
ncbi:hypothetical protein ABIC83_002394 [Roseateles asaccharophilus]|uniref:hypothetical protein n=1 Tax=Roseateles asaccharophilus TaxID=582607 RepID=UPI0038348B30